MLIRGSLVVLALAAPALAQDDTTPSAAELTQGSDSVTQRGLARLVEVQNQQTGNFGDKYKIAATSLSGLALLASGDSAGRGAYGPAIADAVRYILDQKREIRPGHYFFTDGETQGKMHAHGFAMLFLAEAYGHTMRDRDIHEALRGAVAATLDAQTPLGGWGYHLRHEPEWGEDEASVTITQIQGLRAARNAGIFVPAEAVARAVGYVKESMNPDGACRYSLTMGGDAEKNRVSYELTAAAVSTLNASGVYLASDSGEGTDELARGMRWLRKTLRAYPNPAHAATDFYYYGNFYAAQAMYQATEEDWEHWFPQVRADLMSKQRPGGGWESPRNFGEAYATASALLILQMPRRYLPIFQR